VRSEVLHSPHGISLTRIFYSNTPYFLIKGAGYMWDGEEYSKYKVQRTINKYKVCLVGSQRMLVVEH
jgi:hypothetical protein